MKHIFIINPTAGKGRCLDIIKPKIEKYCKENSLDSEVYITKAQGDAMEYVRKTAASNEQIRFYASGGDGTLYEVVNGSYGYKNVEIAIIPLGSGNDFARIFGQDREPLLEIGNQVNGDTVYFDLIKCGERYAINQCSMGLDAEVCAKQAAYKKIPFISGEAAYVFSAVFCLIGKIKNEFEISIDDGPFEKHKVLFALFANSKWYGGGFMGAPKAVPNDGFADSVIVKKDVTRLKAVTLISPYKKGKHLEWDRTLFRNCKKMKIRSKKPAAINVDGECEYNTYAEFELIENAVKIVVPKGIKSEHFEKNLATV